MNNDGSGIVRASRIPSKPRLRYSEGGHDFWNDNPATHTSKKVDEDFISEVWRILDAAGNLLIQKHHDYGPKNIAESPGGPLNGLRVRMWDKIARINNLLDSGVEPSNESLRDSFMDLLNYSAIAMMVLDKTWPGLDD